MKKHNRTQAPWDYDCPYKHSCPHLYWSSTHWIFSEYERSYEEHREHWYIRDLLEEKLAQSRAQIEQLEQQNVQLKAKLKIVHQRQFKANILIRQLNRPTSLSTKRQMTRLQPVLIMV